MEFSYLPTSHKGYLITCTCPPHPSSQPLHCCLRGAGIKCCCLSGLHHYHPAAKAVLRHCVFAVAETLWNMVLGARIASVWRHRAAESIPTGYSCHRLMCGWIIVMQCVRSEYGVTEYECCSILSGVFISAFVNHIFPTRQLLINNWIDNKVNHLLQPQYFEVGTAGAGSWLFRVSVIRLN